MERGACGNLFHANLTTMPTLDKKSLSERDLCSKFTALRDLETQLYQVG